jgi:hypothetical protein
LGFERQQEIHEDVQAAQDQMARLAAKVEDQDRLSSNG